MRYEIPFKMCSLIQSVNYINFLSNLSALEYCTANEQYHTEYQLSGLVINLLFCSFTVIGTKMITVSLYTTEE